MFKKVLFIIFPAICALISCAKVEEGPVAVTSVELDKSELSLQVGKVKYLYATVLPENATDRTVSWASSDSTVATVAQDGTVTGVSAGETVVTATAGDCRDECRVTVFEEKILAESASLSPVEISLYANDTTSLELSYTPSVITEDYIWKSSDTTVAKVDASGKVTAVGQGTADIKVIFQESGVNAKSTVTVTEAMKLRRMDSGEIRTSDLIMVRYKVADTLCFARGEVADFQINVEALKNLSDVRAELVYFCADASNPEIEITPDIYWTGKVYCTRHWNEWHGGYPWNELNPVDRLFPDILIPLGDQTLNILEGENNSLWFDFKIPDNFPDGLYRGRIKITAKLSSNSEIVSATQDFNIRIFPVTLPSEQSLMVINWHGGSYTQMNDGSWDKGSEPDFQWNMRAKTIEFMNDYGQNAWTTMQHTATGPRASIVGGEIIYDFTDWLWEVDFNDRHCRDLKMLEGYCFCKYKDYWNNDVPVDSMFVGNVRYIDERGELRCETLPATDQRTHDHLVNLFSQLSDVLHSNTLRSGKRLIDVYVQSIMDEPYDWHKPGYELVASAIKEGCPDLKILEPSEGPSISENLMDWPCPNLDRLSVDYDKYKARDPQQQWLYVCLRPQGNCANRIFGQRVLNCRLIHWCNYRYNAIGYLHWGLNQWDSFSWKNRCYPTDAYNTKTPDSPGGDHFIIYPGVMKPYPSIRLCNMRDGIKDYELLKMIEKISPSDARDFCYKVVYETPKLYNPSGLVSMSRYKFYDENVIDYRQTRREMLEYLSK